MRFLLSSLFFIVGFFLNLALNAHEQNNSQNNIVLAAQFEIYSKALKEKRQYKVYLPPSYQVKEAKDKTYPVLYVLDGDDTRLKGIAGLVESLSSYNLEQQIPEFVIVAIPNTNRERDLTPTKTNLIFKGETLAEFSESGGADQFISFLSTELVPQIESAYRVNERKGLVGQSFGGLFVAHTLLTQPQLFNDYLITDATFVWDENYLNRMKLDKLKAQTKIGIFVGLANNDHIGEHGVANRAWGNQFIRRLKSGLGPEFNLGHRYFPEERHGTVEMLSWYYGLLSLYK